MSVSAFIGEFSDGCGRGRSQLFSVTLLRRAWLRVKTSGVCRGQRRARQVGLAAVMDARCGVLRAGLWVEFVGSIVSRDKALPGGQLH